MLTVVVLVAGFMWLGFTGRETDATNRLALLAFITGAVLFDLVRQLV